MPDVSISQIGLLIQKVLLRLGVKPPFPKMNCYNDNSSYELGDINMERNWTKILCHNITWLRQHHQFSQEVRAALLHISTDWLEELEGGSIPVDLGIDTLFYIAQYFGVPLDEQLERKLGE